MSDTGAIEGPPSPLLAAGRRQSLTPTEPVARLDQLTQALGGSHGSGAQPIPLTPNNDNQQSEAKSWGSTLFGHFDWTGNRKTSADVEAIYDKTSEDNPMRYKRKARRVSLITSDGSVFNFDVPVDTTKAAAATATHMTQEDAASRFIQVGGVSGAGQPMLQDPAEMRQEIVVRPEIELSSDPPAHAALRRRGSLTEIVAQENIKATESADKLPVILEVPAAESTASVDREEARRKKKSSVFLDSWFFRNPDYKEENENSEKSPVASRKPSTANEPEIGDGKLTRKVINALGLTATTPKKEARDMNSWLPQPGF